MDPVHLIYVTWEEKYWGEWSSECDLEKVWKIRAGSHCYELRATPKETKKQIEIHNLHISKKYHLF